MSWRSDASAADCSSADGSAAAAPASGTPDPASQPLAAELANVPAAVEALQRPGVIAIPTDTLYGEDYLYGMVRRHTLHRKFHRAHPATVCPAMKCPGGLCCPQQMHIGRTGHGHQGTARICRLVNALIFNTYLQALQRWPAAQRASPPSTPPSGASCRAHWPSASGTPSTSRATQKQSTCLAGATCVFMFALLGVLSLLRHAPDTPASDPSLQCDLAHPMQQDATTADPPGSPATATALQPAFLARVQAAAGAAAGAGHGGAAQAARCTPRR